MGLEIRKSIGNLKDYLLSYTRFGATPAEEVTVEQCIQAWFYNETEEDPRQSHQYEPSQPVNRAQLDALGVLQWKFDPESQMEMVDALAKERNYTSRDIVDISKEKLPNYDEKLKIFFTEHIHDDEEVRYILDGSGYFDVRNADDKWVRTHCKKGDLIVLPAGIYHRFILDDTNYVKAMRLFQEDPKWTPINRPCDEHEKRVQYLKSIAVVPATEKTVESNKAQEVVVVAVGAVEEAVEVVTLKVVETAVTQESVDVVTEVATDVQETAQTTVDQVAEVSVEEKNTLDHVTEVAAFIVAEISAEETLGAKADKVVHETVDLVAGVSALSVSGSAAAAE